MLHISITNVSSAAKRKLGPSHHELQTIHSVLFAVRNIWVQPPAKAAQMASTSLPQKHFLVKHWWSYLKSTGTSTMDSVLHKELAPTTMLCCTTQSCSVAKSQAMCSSRLILKQRHLQQDQSEVIAEGSAAEKYWPSLLVPLCRF